MGPKASGVDEAFPNPTTRILALLDIFNLFNIFFNVFTAISSTSLKLFLSVISVKEIVSYIPFFLLQFVFSSIITSSTVTFFVFSNIFEESFVSFSLVISSITKSVL